MPRQLRIDFPGAIHNMMSRRDRREDIYLDDVNRQDFLKTLAGACQKTGWQGANRNLHAWMQQAVAVQTKAGDFGLQMHQSMA
jgi:hypothetical protein